MDPRLRGFNGSMNGIKIENQSVSPFRNWNLVAGPRFEPGFADHGNLRDTHFSKSNNLVSCLSSRPEDDSVEDCDFSDAVLKYISQMLMEEDMDDQDFVHHESLDLQAAEMSFYEALGQKHPPSQDQTLNHFDSNVEGFDGSLDNSNFVDSSWITDEYNTSGAQTVSVNNTSLSSRSMLSSSTSVSNTVDVLVDSPINTCQIPDMYNERQSVWQFNKGVEEASKFLPTCSDLFVKLKSNCLPNKEPKGGANRVMVKVEKRDEGELPPGGLKGRKNPHREDMDNEEERSRKQAAIFSDTVEWSEMFDMVLLCYGNKSDSPLATLREALQSRTGKNSHQKGQLKASSGGKVRSKRQNGKKEVVDLRTLLIHSAQAVAADDCRSASELLKQIRLHSSPFGDGTQRLAHYFANGLEARLAGTGSQIYKALVNKKTSAADMLKAYHLYLAACPFRKVSNFFSNRMIRLAAECTMRLHIIDFGILYGFQWPTFMQHVAGRPGGPPMLRITGIEFPQPGFRPAEKVEETGRRLEKYAKKFGVRFEYNAIAKKWDTIRPEDLKLDRSEMLVVNSLYRFRNLLDETVTVDSSRDGVLNLIRRIEPDLFIHGIVNGAYNAPFFVTRFREALFHYSSYYDMLETNVPREHEERMLIEREIFGREAMNVIACEGWERIERPETYKQWQIRNLRAGFKQLPLDREIVQRATNRVRKDYHKDFMIDEDNHWLLQGWKGRIIYALSAWTPV
ncbi:Transcription factor GRAS [Dillenia turbinata]|uniref:Transcription factor GRAS n=1 Tax=Dillenia turbinata TaxID=194707 RepID=A0AAN8WBT9_9MAGN